MLRYQWDYNTIELKTRDGRVYLWDELAELGDEGGRPSRSFRSRTWRIRRATAAPADMAGDSSESKARWSGSPTYGA